MAFHTTAWILALSSITSATINTCDAFQFSSHPPLSHFRYSRHSLDDVPKSNVAPSIMIPRVHGLSGHYHNKIIFQTSPTLTTAMALQSLVENDNFENGLPEELVPDSNISHCVDHDNHSNALASFGTKLKQVFNNLNVHPSTLPALFLALSIFLLPFFLISAFPEAAWAVQSGGRMGECYCCFSVDHLNTRNNNVGPSKMLFTPYFHSSEQ